VVAAFKIGRVKKGGKKRKRECVLNLLKMKTNWNFVLPAWLPLQSHFPASHSSSLCGCQTCLGAMSTTYSSAGSPKCACAYSSPANFESGNHIHTRSDVLIANILATIYVRFNVRFGLAV